MLCNLFDSNFAHDNYSTAHQSSKYIQWARGLMSFDGVTIFTDEWINNPVVDEVQSKYKIGWLHEPYCLHVDTYKRAWRNAYKFDFILTYFEPMLSNSPNFWPVVESEDVLWRTGKFRLCPYAGTWIDKKDWGIKPKSKLCSMLIGSKMSTEGHRIRHEIAGMIDANGIEFVDFYGARGEPVGYGQETKYRVLQDYYFSLAIETCREDNLFSEWLLDCFAFGTIPLFWGAPNIHEYFNPAGILQFDTVDRLEKILRQLSTVLYAEKLLPAYRNLERLDEYRITEDWIYENVLRELE